MSDLETKLDDKNGAGLKELIKNNSKQWVKEAGEILQYALDDSYFNKNNWKKETRKKRKEYRNKNYDFLVSKGHNKYISKILSGVAVNPMDEKNKEKLEYIVAYAAGGLPERHLDILIDMFRLDKEKVIEANIVVEYFIKAPTAGIEVYLTINAGKFALDFANIDLNNINPVIAGVTVTAARFAYNKYRQIKWEKEDKYVINLFSIINPSALAYYSPLFIIDGIIRTKESLVDLGKWAKESYEYNKNILKEKFTRPENPHIS